MITWMQRHKKWLVITIWISTFAFVGAGFVGWGSYNYGRSSSTVATVGSKEIKITDLQDEYNKLYGQYQQMFGAKFNKELAKQFKLEETAYNTLVQKFLLLNLADKFGLQATNQDVAKELVKIPAFIKNGKFDKQTYTQVLKQNRTTPNEFESRLKRDLTISKLTSIFTTTLNTTTLNNLNKLFFMEDEVSINILDSKNIKINYSNTDIKKLWEKTKDNYKTLPSYQINIVKVPFTKDEKKTKKTALKKYLSLKKEKEHFNKTITINKTTTLVSSENFKKIITSKVGTVLKPIKTKNSFIIVKLIKTIKPQIKPFSDVKDLVKQTYITNSKQQILNKKRDELLQNFKGKNIGYINLQNLPKIKNLSQEETINVVKNIIASQQQINFVELPNKIVVFKIINSKFTNNNTTPDELTKQIAQMKNNEILTNILKDLQSKYTIISNMKVK